MSWTSLLVVVALVAGFFLWRHLTQISSDQARRFLAEGALVIDVRSPEEFQQAHVTGALNIPLGEVTVEVPRQAPNQDQILLVHCLSGGRSGIATHQLKGLGYRRVFNLGSLARAQSIVGGR
jgi:rhodanese-related sulfurtransferase